MAPSPTEDFQTVTPVDSGRSWAKEDQRPPCRRGPNGRRRHCLHHRRGANTWACCKCPHTRTDEQAADPNWSEDS